MTPYTLLYRIRKLKRRATVTLTRRKYRLLLSGCCSLFLFLRGLLPSQGFGFMECCSCLNPGFIRHRFTCVCVCCTAAMNSTGCGGRDWFCTLPRFLSAGGFFNTFQNLSAIYYVFFSYTCFCIL